MGVKFTNNAETTLSSGINNSVTTISVASSSTFPSISGSNYFYATIDDDTNKAHNQPQAHRQNKKVL